MLFPLRQDYIGPFTGNALGSIIQKEITREFLVDSIWVVASGTTTGNIATGIDGLQNLIKRITLTVTDGARTRNVVDCTGPALLEYAAKTANLDARTSQVLNTTSFAAGAFQIAYPIFFRLPHLDDPEGSMFLLPTNRYANNPILTIYVANQSDVDQNASPTFAISGGVTLSIIINRRQLGIANWPIFDTEIIEQNVAFPASGANQIFELPTPGVYTGILIRGYTGAAPNITRSYLVTTNGDYRISVLGTILRRIQPTFLQIQNDAAIGPLQNNSTSGTPTAPLPNVPTVVGSTYFDFLDVSGGRTMGDLGSALDANNLPASGARVQFIGDVNGGTGAHLNFVWHRIFGDVTGMKAALKMAQGG